MTETVEWFLVKREMMNDEKKRDQGAGVAGQGK